jgi:casein kinase II subunit beta
MDRIVEIDGAYFGSTFPHLLLQMYPEFIPPKPTISYVPRIYGFKIHKSARSRIGTRAFAPSPSLA